MLVMLKDKAVKPVGRLKHQLAGVTVVHLPEDAIHSIACVWSLSGGHLSDKVPLCSSRHGLLSKSLAVK
jgi:hypothetical protein